MLPMLGLMVTALVGVSLLNAYLSARRARNQLEQQLREITQTLEQSNFPLTDAVLRQMRGLSGAEFVLLTDSATVLAGEQSLADDCESLAVARRQLDLMERYLQRFLAIGRRSAEADLRPVDLGALVEEILPLVGPAARHAGVDLQWRRPQSTTVVLGDAEGLEQLVINLLLNGIEAAASQAAPGAVRVVRVWLQPEGRERITLLIEDTGPGPSDDVRERLFEPFVTAKADGVGLGLSVAQQVAQQHGGEITWSREPEATRFRVVLPQLRTEKRRAELAGR